MKSDELLDAIGEAKDEYVQDVRTGKASSGWKKWISAIAASLVLIVGAGWILGNLGGESGGSGSGNDLNYMDYIGPVLPLTIQHENPGITAVRNVNYDFSPYITYQDSYGEGENISYYDRYDTEAIITDSYVLTNGSGEDQTVTLLYPQTGSLYDYTNEGMFPTITVNGQPITAGFHPGPYTGAFQGAWGENHDNETLNLKPIENFEGYQHLFSDGSYQASALDDFPVLDQEVIVYQFSDYVYTADETAKNPTIEMSFYIDFDQTYVFTYGMNGGSMDAETGLRACHQGGIRYQPELQEQFQEPDDAYVILMGEDIENYTLQGYRDGGCDEGEELDDLSCTVTRYESTLGEMFKVLCNDYMEYSLPFVFGEDSVHSKALYCALAAELLETHGILGNEPAQRYDWGMIEELFSAVHTDPRIMYYSFCVTIPAGEHITVEFTMRKDASIDFVGEDKGKDGYDMATRLGSNLTFTQQTASICNFEEIEIVAQNFGFDLTNDITSVTLDLNQDHYWMEVRKLPKD